MVCFVYPLSTIESCKSVVSTSYNSANYYFPMPHDQYNKNQVSLMLANSKHKSILSKIY